jgi:hypothetical protein
MYEGRGFKIDVFLADGEFEVMRGAIHEFRGILNTTSNDEHVGDIERYIRTIKERARCTYHTTPFKKMPTVMIQGLVGGCVFWLNAFPIAGGVSDTISPRTIMTGKSINYHRHCKIMFGSYAQVHEDHDNSMQARTTGAIALRPTGNEQGGFYFMSLTTGRQLNRDHWHELPTPQDVIDRVHNLARQSYAARDLVFQYRDGAPLDEDDESAADLDYEPDDEDDESIAGSDYQSMEQEDQLIDEPGIDGYESGESDFCSGGEEVITDVNDVSVSNSDNEDSMSMVEVRDPQLLDMDEEVDESEGYDIAGVGETEDNELEEHKIAGVNETEDPDTEEYAVGVPGPGRVGDPKEERHQHDELEARYGAREHGYDLRPRKPRSYKHRHADLEDMMMTQLSLRKGLKVFGESGALAVTKELQQLHDRRVMNPKAANMLSQSEKSKALPYLMYLKKKRNGTIKGRGCADGRKQRVYKTKEESSSPTVAIESLFLTVVIDAKEDQSVVTCDIPGAFMHAGMDETLYMRIDGPMAELLVNIDPQTYGPYLTTEGGNKPVVYVQLVKALYGMLQAALLFWRNLSGHLMEQGFELNPYDECVANKMVNGKQCTIVWHVDDLKISHADSDVTENIVETLQLKYGSEEAPVTVTRGKVHDYLGMTLNYTTKGKVIVQMEEYVKELLNSVKEEIGGGVAATPAAAHIYSVNPEAERLEQVQADTFHTLTAKLLFLCKRARPDLQQAVGFLTTRVKQPDVEDWKKLMRVLKYLHGTKGLCLTLEADDTKIVKWWVDAAFAVHSDMRSQTGATMSLGRGSVYSSSLRQKFTLEAQLKQNSWVSTM